MLSWVDWMSRKAVTRFGDRRLVNIQVMDKSCACDMLEIRFLLAGSVVLVIGRSNCDIGTSIQCSTTYFMDGKINPIYADYMTYHHGSIRD